MRTFGSQNQMAFTDDREFFQFLGYLAKSDGSTSLVWEHNEEQGAWASEGRIQLFKPLPKQWNVKVTAGVGNIYGRINCNQFIEYIRSQFGFVEGRTQDIPTIQSLIPKENLEDFNDGLAI
jgi:hypothetical protein